MGEGEIDQVVDRQERRARGRGVQASPRLLPSDPVAGEDQGLTRVRTHSGEGMDAAIPLADLQVHREAVGQRGGSCRRAKGENRPFSVGVRGLQSAPGRRSRVTSGRFYRNGAGRATRGRKAASS